MRLTIVCIVMAGLLVLPTTAVAKSSVFLGAYEEEIPLPNHDANSCIAWENCRLLDGVSLVNIDISDAMEKAYDEMQDHHGDDWYIQGEVRDIGYTFALNYMLVCQYREDHSLVGCDRYIPGLRGGVLHPTIDKGTTDLRVLLVDGADAQIYVRLVAMAT